MNTSSCLAEFTMLIEQLEANPLWAGIGVFLIVFFIPFFILVCTVGAWYFQSQCVSARKQSEVEAERKHEMDMKEKARDEVRAQRNHVQEMLQSVLDSNLSDEAKLKLIERLRQAGSDGASDAEWCAVQEVANAAEGKEQ